MEYRVEYNSLYQAFVIFGNNSAGMIPSNGSQIVLTFRVGGGAAGNIVTGAIQYQIQAFVPGLNFSVPGSCLKSTLTPPFSKNTLLAQFVNEINRKGPIHETQRNVP